MKDIKQIQLYILHVHISLVFSVIKNSLIVSLKDRGMRLCSMASKH